MYKQLTLIALALLLSACGSQKEKIKGDRDVISVTDRLPNTINTLTIKDGIEVTLVKATTNDYVLTTDRNLVTVIDFETQDSTLTISSNMDVQRAKELKVYLKLTNPQHINLEGATQLSTPGEIGVSSFSLMAKDGSSANLNIKSTDATVTLQDNSRGRLNIEASNATLTMLDRTDAKGRVKAENFTINMQDNAEYNPEGRATRLTLVGNESADFKGEDLEIATANITLAKRAKAAIKASEIITIYAQDRSSLNVYGNPKVDVQALSDKAEISKK